MTIVRQLFAICLLLVLSVYGSAQQDMLYTQYRFNNLAINPAYAGNHNTLSLTGLARKQWIGVQGAPGIFSISGHIPLASNKVGLGLSVFQEKIAVTKNLHLCMAYSYKIINGDNRLSFGLQGAVSNYSQLLNQLENINTQDLNFMNNVQRTMFNVGAGIFYETNSYFVSFSMPQLLQNYYEPDNPSSGRQVRQYFLMGGYGFRLNPQLKLKTIGMARYDEDFPPRFDININLHYNEKICTGISYKHKDSFSALLELAVSDKAKFGISYDYLTSEFRKVARGSMEVMVNYKFGKGAKKKHEW